MKKYFAPELNVTKFDVEDVITTSIVADTAAIYFDSGENKNVDHAATVDYSEIFA